MPEQPEDELSPLSHGLRIYGYPDKENAVYTPPGSAGTPDFREYDLFTEYPLRYTKAGLAFELCNIKEEGGANAGLRLYEVETSEVDATYAHLNWKLLTFWVFTQNPLAEKSGWGKEELDEDGIVCRWHNDWSEKPWEHWLEIRGGGSSGQMARWKCANIFRNPILPDDYYRPTPTQTPIVDEIDAKNRLLKFVAVLSWEEGDSNPTTDRPPAMNFVIGNDYTHEDQYGDSPNTFQYEYCIGRLVDNEGNPVAAGTPVPYTFYLAPPHHMLVGDTNEPTIFPQLSFSFEMVDFGGAQVDHSASVYLRSLHIYETNIADLPSGYRFQQQDEPWPEVHIPKLDEGFDELPIKVSHPTEHPDKKYWHVHDHGLTYSGGRWHIYGIWAGTGAWDGTTCFWHDSRLAHFRSQNLDHRLGEDRYGDGWADFEMVTPTAVPTPTPPDDIDAFEPDWFTEPGHLWAPSFTNYDGEECMFYSVGSKYVYMAKNWHSELFASEWKRLNKDGTIPSATPTGTPTPDPSPYIVDRTIVADAKDPDVMKTGGQFRCYYIDYVTGKEPLPEPSRVSLKAGSEPGDIYNGTPTCVFKGFDPQSGHPCDNESSCVVFYNGLYYLFVGKHVPFHPGQGLGLDFVVDWCQPDTTRVFKVDPITGDREELLGTTQGTLKKPRGAVLRSPAKMTILDADPTGKKLVELNLRNGNREPFDDVDLSGLTDPIDVALRSSNLPRFNWEYPVYYVSDYGDVNTRGTVYQFAPDENCNYIPYQIGSSTDFLHPTGLFHDGADTLYVADEGEGQVAGTVKKVQLNTYPTVITDYPPGNFTSPYDVLIYGDHCYVLDTDRRNNFASPKLWKCSLAEASPTPTPAPVAINLEPYYFVTSVFDGGDKLLVTCYLPTTGAGKLLAINLETNDYEIFSGEGTAFDSPTCGVNPKGDWAHTAYFPNLGYKVFWSDDGMNFPSSHLVTTLEGVRAVEVTEDNDDQWYVTFSQLDYSAWEDLHFLGREGKSQEVPEWWAIRKLIWAYPPDRDNDGIPDEKEGFPPVGGESNMYLFDSDGDGLSDGREDANKNGSKEADETGTRDIDSDDDGLSDGLEVLVLETDPLDSGDPSSYTDADGDGVPSGPPPYNIDPNDSNVDADGDTYRDSYEFEHGTDPADANDKPCLGDLNEDGEVTNTDWLIGRRLTLGIDDWDDYNVNNMDVNRDGCLTNTDWVYLRRYVLQLVGFEYLPAP